MKVVADISCDVEGSVPITWKATTIKDPVIGWSRREQKPCEPWTDDSIDVMAVSNLPNELPCDASEEFGEHMLQYVFPELLSAQSRMIAGATITEAGSLTAPYAYLQDYVNG
jgi:hypothetical protein